MKTAVGIILLLCVPARAELGKPALPSPVIIPLQRLPLSFSHELHLGRKKLSCDYCHESAPSSTRAADVLIPPESACAACHTIERQAPDLRCGYCHPGFTGAGAPERVVVPPPNLKFNHKIHTDRKIRCQTCHGDLLQEKVGLATREQLPRMSLCLSCHDGKRAPARCTTCHLSEPGGLVRTAYPEGTLMPSGALRGDAHDLRFRADHARAAQNDPRYCAACHRQESCAGCHEGTEKPLDFHAGDYVSLHPIEARSHRAECGSCHRLQTFCTGCHARAGVSDDPKGSEYRRPSQTEPGQAGPRFHPDGWWLGNDPAGPRSRHGIEARRDLRACASCHREQLCLDCHAQVSPHPLGWARSARCAALAARAGRACLRCHLTADSAQCD